MEEYGSRYAHVIDFCDTWIFISSNRKNLAENYEGNSEAVEQGGWIPPLFVEVAINLEVTDKSSCAWWKEEGDEYEEVLRRRIVFCALYEGFGNVCHCKFVLKSLV